MENCHAMVLVTMVRQFFIGTFCVYRPKREISLSGSFSCTIQGAGFIRHSREYRCCCLCFLLPKQPEIRVSLHRLAGMQVLPERTYRNPVRQMNRDCQRQVSVRRGRRNCPCRVPVRRRHRNYLCRVPVRQVRRNCLRQVSVRQVHRNCLCQVHVHQVHRNCLHRVLSRLLHRNCLSPVLH